MTGRPAVAGVVLAGGAGRRIGGDKPLRLLAGRPLIEHVIERVRGQVDRLILSANGNEASLAAFGLPLVADAPAPGGRQGPVAGVLAGLAAARAGGFPRLAVFPCDAPFLPADLVARLGAELDRAPGAAAAIVTDGKRPQPTFALWRAEALEPLAALLAGGTRRLEAATRALGCVEVPIPASAGLAAWYNINSPEDLAEAEEVVLGNGTRPGLRRVKDSMEQGP